jgi:hypothetical protein
VTKKNVFMTMTPRRRPRCHLEVLLQLVFKLTLFPGEFRFFRLSEELEGPAIGFV